MAFAAMSSFDPLSGHAQDYDISWYTVDGGGAMMAVGASFELSGTIGQPDAGTLTGSDFELIGGFWGAGAAGELPQVTIVSANPPAASGNPYAPGQPFRDVLDTGTSSALTAGIGGAGTPPQGSIEYAQISVTFSAAPSPAPSVSNVSIDCTGGTCPSVVSVSGSGAGPFLIALSAPIPPANCTTLTFSGTEAGQKLAYQSLPADVNLDSASNTQDLLWLVQRLNDGSANQIGNLARYNIDRTGGVNTQVLLRIVQFLNGVNATQTFNGATVAACP
jgi:hypothetical protein